MTNILEAEKLNITYDEGSQAVIDLTLSLGYGEILTVVGGSGSGRIHNSLHDAELKARSRQRSDAGLAA